MTNHPPARTTTRPIRRILVAGLLVVSVATAALGGQMLASSSSRAGSPVDVLLTEHRDVLGEALPSSMWPVSGQAAVVLTGQSQIHAGPNQHAAPIASVAKVMTAYLVLRDHPLRPGEDGPTITLTAADVADTYGRREQQESVVPVAIGEQLNERQALQALLLPSANNIAAVLARWDAGSENRFVARMNSTARSLGMAHTSYTDPSGYDDATVSTAAAQVRIVERAMRLPVFANIVATPSATLPVAGTVHNTNTLLGHDGFVGVKTGSDDAAGGCFAFRAIRWIDGKRTTITGVVLGQPGDDQIMAGLAAADAMVSRIAGQRLRHHRPTRHSRPTLAAPGSPKPLRWHLGRRRAGSDDAGLVGEDDGLNAVAQAEFREHPPDMRLDGGVGHDELLGDLRVGEAAGDEFQDVELAGRQVVELWGRLLRGWVVADERLDQPPGDGRGEQGFSVADGADARDELFGWDVLEQESARAGMQRVEDVLVEVEGGQHEHAWRMRALHDPPCGLEPVDGRHPDVHEDDVGPGATRGVDGLGAISGLGDHVQVWFGLENHPKAGAHERLVVGDQDADGHASTLAPSGSRAWMSYPPASAMPARNSPP